MAAASLAVLCWLPETCTRIAHRRHRALRSRSNLPEKSEVSLQQRFAWRPQEGMGLTSNLLHLKPLFLNHFNKESVHHCISSPAAHQLSLWMVLFPCDTRS